MLKVKPFEVENLTPVTVRLTAEETATRLKAVEQTLELEEVTGELPPRGETTAADSDLVEGSDVST
jgi:hypothetical protein